MKSGMLIGRIGIAVLVQWGLCAWTAADAQTVQQPAGLAPPPAAAVMKRPVANPDVQLQGMTPVIRRSPAYTQFPLVLTGRLARLPAEQDAVVLNSLESGQVPLGLYGSLRPEQKSGIDKLVNDQALVTVTGTMQVFCPTDTASMTGLSRGCGSFDDSASLLVHPTELSDAH
jgi:hypothetical protein